MTTADEVATAKRSFNLSKVVQVRMTDADYVKLKEYAQDEDISMSDWLRLRIDPQQFEHAEPTKRPTPKKAKERSRPYHKADPELIAQLARIGNNLNQLARIANTTKDLPTLVQLASIEQLLIEVLKK